MPPGLAWIMERKRKIAKHSNSGKAILVYNAPKGPAQKKRDEGRRCQRERLKSITCNLDAKERERRGSHAQRRECSKRRSRHKECRRIARIGGPPIADPETIVENGFNVRFALLSRNLLRWGVTSAISVPAPSFMQMP